MRAPAKSSRPVARKARHLIHCRGEACDRVFEGTDRAQFCPRCRYLTRKPKSAKWLITDQVRDLLTIEYDTSIPGRVAEIARKLNWPRSAVKRAASQIGIARSRSRDWTPEEEALLRDWEGRRSPGWFAKRLKRSETSIIQKQKAMRLSRRVTDGYTRRDLCECMGVSPSVVDRWIRLNLIRTRRSGKGVGLIAETSVTEFLRVHQQEYRLPQVDQTWFLELIFSTRHSNESPMTDCNNTSGR